MAVKRFLLLLGFSTLLANPVHAQSGDDLLCDQVSFEVFPRSSHFKGFSGQFAIHSSGFAVTCGLALPLSGNVKAMAGLSAMSFVNSFDTQSYSFGATIEVQYRPDKLEGVGFYAGVEVGLIHGYDGYFAEDRMIGSFAPAGSLKGGLLFDIPETTSTVFFGVRVVPSVFGYSGIVSPTIGLTYAF